MAHRPPPEPGGGLAGWSIHHPIGVVMIFLAIIVLGGVALTRLGVDLLPDIVYPAISVRVNDPGVPATIMEDRVTRQLEEQLAITEDVVSVQSRSSEGRSVVSLSFAYGKDIDAVLQDASARLDRAKRYLPESLAPPRISKRDPSQQPAAEFAVSSPLREPRELRDWVDYEFSNWFLTLPGVASLEVGGAPRREIAVLPDQRLLAAHDLTVDRLVNALRTANRDAPGGALRMADHEIGGRMSGRFESVEEIARLPLEVHDQAGTKSVVKLQNLAEVIDTQEDERLRVRLNAQPGIKLSIQKQPQANTVTVVDTVMERLNLLADENLIPGDISIQKISDQAVYIRQSIANATNAAFTGMLLAMLVVYVFLGDIRRTLIIGTSIPIGATVALILMDLTGLTLNIMTLGGLALGVGLLVDNTIVMLENIYRHQRQGEQNMVAPIYAAAEVNSAIVASTSTNLAAVLPFLFIGGLVGLLFRDLILTISSSIAASLVVALTLVPALGARVPITQPGCIRRDVDRALETLQDGYRCLLRRVLIAPWALPVLFVAALAYTVPVFQTSKDVFLPSMDTSRVVVRVIADVGTHLDETDATVSKLEELFMAQPEVVSVFSQIGGYVYGRSETESGNRSTIKLQLLAPDQRSESSEQWIERIMEDVHALRMPGIRVWMYVERIRGIRIGRGDDRISVRVQGPDLETLTRIGDELVPILEPIAGIRNVRHSLQLGVQELSVRVDRERAAALGLDVESIGDAFGVALRGKVATDFIDGDRMYNVRVRLPPTEFRSPVDLESILLFPGDRDREPVYLGDVATLTLINSPAQIKRDQQQRIMEVSARTSDSATLGEVMTEVERRLSNIELPSGYVRYDGGAVDTLRNSRSLAERLLGLALFLVLVVMAIQYESLRNPLVILLSVPFAAIGVGTALSVLELPLSMPLWLGMIMLSGIVVNNAIVLVEYIEIERRRGVDMQTAIVEAGGLRLRPILMTTLTTVAGMTPLAMGFGEGSEMLQPLAITLVWGLSFSMLVSLLLVPCVYRLMCGRDPVTQSLATRPVAHDDGARL